MLRLQKKGYAQRFRELFLWHFTPFPVGDGEHVMAAVKRFLSVRRANRGRWLRKQDNRIGREMVRIRESISQEAAS